MNLSEEKKLNLSSNIASFRKSTAFQAGVCSIIANLQTKAEDLSELREMFTRLDTNNDGFLSQEELENGMADIAQIFHLREPDVRDWIKAADVNGDGQLDYTEFIAAAYQKDLLLSKKNLQAAFRRFDADGDGKVSREEIKEVFGGANVQMP